MEHPQSRPFEFGELTDARIVRCPACAHRLADRGILGDNWVLVVKIDKTLIFSAWMITNCPGCGAWYELTAAQGIVREIGDGRSPANSTDGTDSPAAG